jgi:shikimate dehydrogenase
MPGKRLALGLASVVSARARRVGAANTLARRPDGTWAGDCTDIDGVAGALRAAGPASGADRAVVLGSGATACAAIGGLADLGVGAVTLVVREPGRAAPTVDVAHGFGLAADAVAWSAVSAPDLAAARAVVNTTPAGSVDEARAAFVAGAVPAGAVVLDAVYHPWPTPLATAAAARGLAVATGLDMLLHQAFGQVEQFTGLPAPRAAMHEALQATTDIPLLPLP